MRKSIRDLSPKTYAPDSFDVKCQVIFQDGPPGEERKTPEVVIFDERGEEYAATFLNCPIGSENRKRVPTEVNLQTVCLIMIIEDKSMFRFSSSPQRPQSSYRL